MAPGLLGRRHRSPAEGLAGPSIRQQGRATGLPIPHLSLTARRAPDFFFGPIGHPRVKILINMMNEKKVTVGAAVGLAIAAFASGSGAGLTLRSPRVPLPIEPAPIACRVEPPKPPDPVLAPDPAPVAAAAPSRHSAVSVEDSRDRLRRHIQRVMDRKGIAVPLDAASVRVANQEWLELHERVLADPSLFLALLKAESNPDRIEALLTLLDDSWTVRPSGLSRIGTPYDALPEEIRRALKDGLTDAPSGTKLAILRHFGAAAPAAIVRDNLDLLLADPEWEVQRRALEVVATVEGPGDVVREKIDALLQRGFGEDRKRELLDFLSRRLWSERVGGAVSHPDRYVTMISSAMNATTSPETFTACLKAATELPSSQAQLILTMAEPRCPTAKLKNVVSRMLVLLRDGETPVQLQRLIE